jgi:hypothetical protein
MALSAAGEVWVAAAGRLSQAPREELDAGDGSSPNVEETRASSGPEGLCGQNGNASVSGRGEDDRSMQVAVVSQGFDRILGSGVRFGNALAD